MESIHKGTPVLQEGRPEQEDSVFLQHGKVISKTITGYSVNILLHSVKKASSKSLVGVKNLPTKYVLSSFLRRFLRRCGAGREVESIFALHALFLFT